MKKDMLQSIALVFSALSLIDRYANETGEKLLIPNDYELINLKPPKKEGLVIVNVDCPTNFLAFSILDKNKQVTYKTIECNGTGYYSFYCIPETLVYIGAKQPVNYITTNAELLYCSRDSAVFLIHDAAAITAKKDFFEF